MLISWSRRGNPNTETMSEHDTTKIGRWRVLLSVEQIGNCMWINTDKDPRHQRHARTAFHQDWVVMSTCECWADGNCIENQYRRDKKNQQRYQQAHSAGTSPGSYHTIHQIPPSSRIIIPTRDGPFDKQFVSPYHRSESSPMDSKDNQERARVYTEMRIGKKLQATTKSCGRNIFLPAAGFRFCIPWQAIHHQQLILPKHRSFLPYGFPHTVISTSLSPKIRPKEKRSLAKFGIVGALHKSLQPWPYVM